MPRRPMRSLEEFCLYVKAAGMAPATVIDVGVCYGTPELYAAFPEAHHVLFEPVPSLEPRLKALAAKLGGEYHMVALSDAAGRMPMTVPEGAVEGSSLAVAPGANTVEVAVETLDRVLGGRDLARPIFLKTDCQGYDMHVMRGGRELLRGVDVVVCETNLFHPRGRRDLPDFGDTVLQMRELGFAVYDILSYQTRPLDDALGYVDLAFAREDGPLRARHQWA